jgi:hypothetical protein
VTHGDTRIHAGLHGHAFWQVSGCFDALTSTFRNAPSALTRRRTGVRVPQRPLRTGWSAVFFWRFSVEFDREVRLRSVRDRNLRVASNGSVSSASAAAEVTLASEVMSVKCPGQVPRFRSGDVHRRPQVRASRRLRVSRVRPSSGCRGGCSVGGRPTRRRSGGWMYQTRWRRRAPIR